MKTSMANPDASFSSGDKCFLFSRLPFWELRDHLPLEIWPGVHFVQTPKHALKQSSLPDAPKEEHMAWSGWVYPGYGLPGINVWDICIKIDHEAKIPAESKNLWFWMAVAALFIVKPLFISVSGAFTYGDRKTGFLGKNTERLDYRSNICLEGQRKPFQGQEVLSFKIEDFNLAKHIFPSLIRIINSQKTSPRELHNLSTFLQAAFWERLNYSSSIFSKLFPFIDSFTGNPPSNHSKKISERAGNFLSETRLWNSKGVLAKEAIKSRTQFIWEIHRYPELHGHFKEPFSMTSDQSREPQLYAHFDKDLFDLFEISRLLLLKMMLLDDTDLHAYSQIPIPEMALAPNDERAKTLNKERDLSAQSFFARSFKCPTGLSSYSDLLPKPELQN